MLSKCVIMAAVVLATVHCVCVVPQRANVTFTNDKWVLNTRLWITRLSRKSPYFMNLEIQLRHTWGNNVTAHFVFYEFLNNQYRRTFMELHAPFCDMLWNYPMGFGTMLLQKGVHCPTAPGFYGLYNLTVPMTNFHYLIPFVKFKVEVEFALDTNQSMVVGYIYGSFVTEKRIKKN